jgi:FAD/FMN-containing dehydrogenase
VRGLEVALATGEIVSWNGAAKAPGPALWRTFVGAEGTLGVVTRVIAQLYPLPEARRFAAYRFPPFADGFQAISHMRAVGLHASMVDDEEIGETPLASPADLYLAFDGPDGVVRPTLSHARRICRDVGGTDRGVRAAERFWEHRHDTAYQFMKRRSFAPPAEHQPHVVYANVAVPRSRVLSYCSHVVDIARRHGVAVHSFGIWGRPEFVSFILEGQSGGAQPGPLELAADDSLLLARQEGGSIEYCHGVGIRLAHLISAELGSVELLLNRLKTALDPSCVLNPANWGSTGHPDRNSFQPQCPG